MEQQKHRFKRERKQEEMQKMIKYPQICTDTDQLLSLKLPWILRTSFTSLIIWCSMSLFGSKCDTWIHRQKDFIKHFCYGNTGLKRWKKAHAAMHIKNLICWWSHSCLHAQWSFLHGSMQVHTHPVILFYNQRDWMDIKLSWFDLVRTPH